MSQNWKNLTFEHGGCFAPEFHKLVQRCVQLSKKVFKIYLEHFFFRNFHKYLDNELMVFIFSFILENLFEQFGSGWEVFLKAIFAVQHVRCCLIKKKQPKPLQMHILFNINMNFGLNLLFPVIKQPQLAVVWSEKVLETCLMLVDVVSCFVNCFLLHATFSNI